VEYKDMAEVQSKKRVVVTGGAGFIGSHLSRTLLDRGYEVHVIDNLSEGKKEAVPAGATLHVIDTRHYDDIAPVINGAHAVFQMAAIASVQRSIESPIETHDINVTGTLNVLRAAQETGAKVIFSSSAAVYGKARILPTSEDVPVMPLSPYGLHKHVGEQYLSLFAKVYGAETVSLRYFNVYGPGQRADSQYSGVISLFLKLHREGNPLSITGDGTQTRDFVYIDDVVEANIAAMESNVKNGEVINIGSGMETSINTLAKTIGGEMKYISLRAEIKNSVADIGKAKKLLGWEPKVALAEGLKKII
jgi:UDP-glucose 4-epimerase